MILSWRTFGSAVEYLTKIILQSDSLFHSIRNQLSLISKLISLVLNSLLILKCNSNFGEYVLNYVKMDTSSMKLISDSPKKIPLIVICYVLPIIVELVSKFKFSESAQGKRIIKALKVIHQLLDVVYNLKYVFSTSFPYSNIVEHLLGFMTVNQGNKDLLSDKILNFGQQINLFFLYIFIKLGEWYYSNETKSNDIVQIEPPKRTINNVTGDCAICASEIKRPVAVKCCGYVFCEECIMNSMKRKDECPMCKNDLSELDIIRIYN